MLRRIRKIWLVGKRGRQKQIISELLTCFQIPSYQWFFNTLTSGLI